MNTTETIQLGVPAEVTLASTEPAPVVVALVLALLGVGLAVAGVYLLFGLGWALLAGAVPLLVLAGAMLRGLNRA